MITSFTSGGTADASTPCPVRPGFVLGGSSVGSGVWEGSKGTEVQLVDVDGDGWVDITVNAENAGCMVRVYKNQGAAAVDPNSTFAPMMYASTGHSCKGSRSFGGTWQWVDGDGDGDLEFLLAWYENVRYYYQTSPACSTLTPTETSANCFSMETAETRVLLSTSITMGFWTTRRGRHRLRVLLNTYHSTGDVQHYATASALYPL